MQAIQYQNNAEFSADFESVEKNVKNLLSKELQATKRAKWTEQYASRNKEQGGTRG